MAELARVSPGHHVVGMGACGLDMLAAVERYPKPDEKTRTIQPIQYQGGGNCANTLVALSRLGVRCTLVAKIGQDSNGDLVREELVREGICVDFVFARKCIQTPFTYIIVDRRDSTRTCIHTPAAEGVLCSDLDTDAILRDASICLLDTRHTPAAIKLANAALQKHIPVVLDVEREREGLNELIASADYLVTNTAFPQLYAPKGRDRKEAMCLLLLGSGAKMVITTLGASGSILVMREGDYPAKVREGCDKVWGNSVTSTLQRLSLDINKISNTYKNTIPGVRTGGFSAEECILIVECPAADVDALVDTTGAGDAFIGGIVYGLSSGLGPTHMLVLAAKLAAKKLGSMGARKGLPTWSELNKTLSNNS